MNQVLVVGSLNMDTVITVENLPKDGETIIAKDVSRFCGGKGSNQAIAIARLGGNAIMFGKLGNDENGRELITRLKKEGVTTEYIGIEESASTGSAFINVDRRGTNTIVVDPGANYSMDKKYINEKSAVFSVANYCLLQYEIPMETVEFIITKCYEEGVKVIVNPSPVAEIKEDLYKKIDILIVNETELSELSGMEVLEDVFIRKAMSVLINKGVRCVIATLGPKGSLYMDANYKVEYQEAFKVDAIDTTAAGDTFTGALIASFVKGGDLKASMRFANAAGAIAVQTKGAQNSIPKYADVEKFIAERKK
ncbi:ribokinase [Clostridium formicaceticum]|uniref:Ribokinase n=1 Tax=Clostridium formicaceticum TaxID=1497 RepID=A0AAC9RKI6_9CLOT|nr:ribokinase [Clostridium formicaceticum]AOY76555.1 ribokinase [Clostridium formicaceticum]ARE86973.1 Ribokinase [Clostridium formicaceticum]